MGQEELATYAAGSHYTGLGYRLETIMLLSPTFGSILIASAIVLNDDTFTGGEQTLYTFPSTGTVSNRLSFGIMARLF